jgi:hypothetical protein
MIISTVAVDGVGEIDVGGGVAADPNGAWLLSERGAEQRDGVLACGRAPVVGRDHGEKGVCCRLPRAGAIQQPAARSRLDRPNRRGRLGSVIAGLDSSTIGRAVGLSREHADGDQEGGEHHDAAFDYDVGDRL